MDTEQGSKRWSIVVGVLTVLIIILIVVLIVLIILSILAREEPCKTDATCLKTQVCDISTGKCLAKPGQRCRTNSDCSSLAPHCNPSGKYCTNDVTKGLGTAGNPPRQGTPYCDGTLALNANAGLCQYTTIGSPCTGDSSCMVGLCAMSPGASQGVCMHTLLCGGNTIVNPSQCAPGLVCDPVRLVCTIQGVVPGGDGAPCVSSSDCTSGCTCSGSGGSVVTPGLCKCGTLSFMDNIVGGTPGLPSLACYPPLTGDGTSWCRYDIDRFMICKSGLDCQYPYSECAIQPGNSTGICTYSPSVDQPPPNLQGHLTYFNMGYNQPSVAVRGAIYVAGNPTTGVSTCPSIPTVQLGTIKDNTGGTLIVPYSGICDIPEGISKNFLSFSKKSAFCMSSLALDFIGGASTNRPTGLSYSTAIYEDPRAVLVGVGINTTGFGVVPWCVIYRQNYIPPGASLPELFTTGAAMGLDRPIGPDPVMWNPSAIRLANSTEPDVSFVVNPVVSSWIVTPEPPGVSDSWSTIGVTSLMAVGTPGVSQVYRLCVMVSEMTKGSYNWRQGLTAGTSCALIGQSELLTHNHIIVSWDALVIQPVPKSGVQLGPEVFAVFYIHDLVAGKYAAYAALGTFEMVRKYPGLFDNQGILKLTNEVVGTDQGIQLIDLGVDVLLTNPTTQIRISRTNQSVEPLVALNVFTIGPVGMDINTYTINTTSIVAITSTSSYHSVSTLKSIKLVKYVTSMTSIGGLGCFVVWCSTSETADAFVVVQSNVGTSTLHSFQVFSAVFWRRLASETLPYAIYPIGGDAMPAFLITGETLRFDGSPQ